MIRAVTEADAEAIYELLFAARDEIPLSKIETDPKEDWLNCIRLWCALNRSLVAELNGEVVSVAIVIARTHLSAGNGGVVASDWELFYGTTRKEYVSKSYSKRFPKSHRAFETIYAQVHPATNRRWRRRCFDGFYGGSRSYNGTVEFKLTRDR